MFCSFASRHHMLPRRNLAEEYKIAYLRKKSLEDDFVKIERMLEIFKDGVRPPSNFRKIKEWKDEEWAKYELE